MTKYLKYPRNTNKPGTRGQASNGKQEHYADRWVSLKRHLIKEAARKLFLSGTFIKFALSTACFITPYRFPVNTYARLCKELCHKLYSSLTYTLTLLLSLHSVTEEWCLLDHGVVQCIPRKGFGILRISCFVQRDSIWSHYQLIRIIPNHFWGTQCSVDNDQHYVGFG